MAQMRLPKFWRSTGSWNDPVILIGQFVGVVGCIFLGEWLESPWLAFGVMIISPLFGFFLGLGVVVMLTLCFGKNDT